MTTEFSRRDFLKVVPIELGGFFLAACTPNIPQTQEATLAPSPFLTDTRVPTDTVTPSPTNTPEPTATPEWLNADPNATETWPSWAQEYFKDPDTATDDEDRRFDQFLTDARISYFERLGQQNPEKLRTLLDYLVQGGVLTSTTRESIAGMGKEDMLTTLQSMHEADRNKYLLQYRSVFWLNLIHSATEHRPVILSPNEIRHIDKDRNAYVKVWSGFFANAPESNMKYRVGYGFDGYILETPYFNFQDWKPIIYGKTIRDPIYFLYYTVLSGDIAGLVELPKNNGYALLMRVRNKEGQPFLHIFHDEDKGLTFDPGQLSCAGTLYSGATYAPMECPPKIHGDVSRFAVYPQGGYRSDWHTLTPDVIREWLTWPPVFAKQEITVQLDSGGLINYILHPQTNLLVARKLQIIPPEKFQNQP